MKKALFVWAAALAVAAGTLSSAPAQASAWPTRQKWSPEMEKRFSEWVKKDWNETVFLWKGTPWQGLKVDCADTVYTMRMVFSYLNGLPFVMQDPSRRDHLITSEISKFDHIADRSERARAFMKYVYEIGSTVTLPNDTYPVAVNREAVKPGGLILTDPKSHHSWTIKDVLPIGIPHLIFSSRPAKSHILVRIGQPTTGFTFQGRLTPSRHAGFRAFRPVEFIGKPVWTVPGYSEEQYQIPLGRWSMVVQKRLASNNESHSDRLKRLIGIICENLKDRATAVDEGLAYLEKIPSNRCLNAQEYDDYSTPNKDQRLKESFEELQAAYEFARQDKTETLLAPVHEEVTRVLGKGKHADSCPITIAPGRVLTLDQIMERSLNKRLSSNPHDPLEYRWGDRAGHGARASRCPKYD